MQTSSRAIRYVEARVCWNDWSPLRSVTYHLSPHLSLPPLDRSGNPHQSKLRAFCVDLTILLLIKSTWVMIICSSEVCWGKGVVTVIASGPHVTFAYQRIPRALMQVDPFRR